MKMQWQRDKNESDKRAESQIPDNKIERRHDEALMCVCVCLCGSLLVLIEFVILGIRPKPSECTNISCSGKPIAM